MKYVILLFVAVSLLALSGTGIAPTVCLGLEASQAAILGFMSDPQPDFILGAPGLIDATLTCPP